MISEQSTNNINVEDADLYIGSLEGGNIFDGLMDEMVVFDDILSTSEIDDIRQGNYGADAGVQKSVAGAMRMNAALTKKLMAKRTVQGVI